MEKDLKYTHEDEEFGRELGNDFSRMRIAGGVAVVSTLLALVFPPAIGGTIVGVEEVSRNMIKLNLRVIRYHSNKK